MLCWYLSFLGCLVIKLFEELFVLVEDRLINLGSSLAFCCNLCHVVAGGFGQEPTKR